MERLVRLQSAEDRRVLFYMTRWHVKSNLQVKLASEAVVMSAAAALSGRIQVERLGLGETIGKRCPRNHNAMEFQSI